MLGPDGRQQRAGEQEVLAEDARLGQAAALPVAQLERDIVSSNLSLYDYNNTSILIGPQIRF